MKKKYVMFIIVVLLMGMTSFWAYDDILTVTGNVKAEKNYTGVNIPLEKEADQFIILN